MASPGVMEITVRPRFRACVIWFVLVMCGGFLGMFLGCRAGSACLPEIAPQPVSARDMVDVDVTPTNRCTRCNAMHRRDAMAVYRNDKQPEILLCPRCVYQQAESFIKFCPVEE